jgi:hypothetical protein
VGLHQQDAADWFSRADVSDLVFLGQDLAAAVELGVDRCLSLFEGSEGVVSEVGE